MPASHQVADSPRELGLDPTKVEELFKRAEREVTEGLLPSARSRLRAMDGSAR
jgi:hypothetical protein